MNISSLPHSLSSLLIVGLALAGAPPLHALAQEAPDKLPAVVDDRPTSPSLQRGKGELRDLESVRRRAAEKRPAASSSSSSSAERPLLAQGEAPIPGTPKKCRPARGTFSFNADKETIESLLKRISQLTCKNFIVAESVKGKSDITIISHQPVNVWQAEAAFLAALEANNMALVPAGAYWKVVERKDAVKQSLPMYETADELPSTDAQVTLLYELKYADSNQVQSLLRNLLSRSGDLQVVGGNLLIITDAASNIQRLTKIISRIDVSGSSARLHVVKVVWADAQQVAQKLQEIFKDATPRAGAARAPARARAATPGAEAGAASEPGDAEDLSIDKIIPDERTNKLIIIASQKAFESLKEVIDLLDVPGDDTSTGTRIFVHALNNTDATKAAATLSSLAQSGAPRRAANQRGGAAAAPAQQQSAELFEGEVKVTADETTNSLVIVSSPRDYKALKRVLEELDARRPQVFVEAAIMEVGVNHNRRVGLDAYTGLPITVPGLEGQGLGILANEGGKNLVVSSAQALAARSLFERLNTNTIDATQLGAAVDASTALDSLLGVVAFQGPAVPGSEDIFGFPVPSFGVVLNALATNANVNVLSTPHIMTTDNEKAEISVGERIPVVRGYSPVGGGAAGGFLGGLQQVAYEDVKLKFTVTPHVNDAGEIRVELEQEVSDLGGSIPVGNGLDQPIITNRTVKTTVVVRDQQTVVLGGLMADRETDSESKIPILGDIPLIGWLFKNWSDTKSKTNLILVLTPYIVRTEDDFRKIYERKLRERKEFLELYYGIAADYNPYIDYDKKTGPLGKLAQRVDFENMKVENGGPGLPGDLVITPEAEITPFPSSSGLDDELPPDADMPSDAAMPTGDEPPVPNPEAGIEGGEADTGAGGGDEPAGGAEGEE